MMKQILFIFCLIALSYHSSNAQTGKDRMSLNERFWYGLSLGNIGIGNNYATIGLSPLGGFKITRDWAVGATYKMNYSYYWFGDASDNLHVFDHGPGVLTKYKFLNRKYFVQLEYDYLSMGVNNFGYSRQWYPFAYIGGGLSKGDDRAWTTEWVILYNVHPASNSNFFPLSLSYSFLYKF